MKPQGRYKTYNDIHNRLHLSMYSQVANWKIEREVGEEELFTNGKKEKACRCPQEKQRKTTI